MRERDRRATVTTLAACAASGNHHFLSRERYVALFSEGGYELARDERFLEKDLLLVFRPSSAH